MCIDINFPVLWSFGLSFFLVHFKNATRWTVQVFIPLMRFPLLFCSSGIIFSYFFHHLHLFDGVHFQDSQVLVVSFLPSILMLSWFDISILSIVSLFLHFILSIAHFSMPNSIPTSWLFYVFRRCQWCDTSSNPGQDWLHFT